MELNFDWKNFHSLFFQSIETKHAADSAQSKPVFVLKDNGFVSFAFSEGENLLDWVGAPEDEIRENFKHREIVFLNKSTADGWMLKSTNHDLYYDQVKFLKSQAFGFLKKNKKNLESYFLRHFLLESIESWWNKFLPSSYGMFLRFDGEQNKDYVLIVQKDKISGFNEPDLTALGVDQRKDLAAVVKYLSEKYFIPVQGFVLDYQKWKDIASSPEPWKKTAFLIRSGQIKLAPFRWRLVFLIASRAFLGL
ncbi:MAG: hypothetical protein HY843_01350 [Bdellovibrio sp.]|nr:hypothetical protein [Bdellovibrio sp.]